MRCEEIEQYLADFLAGEAGRATAFAEGHLIHPLQNLPAPIRTVVFAEDPPHLSGPACLAVIPDRADVPFAFTLLDVGPSLLECQHFSRVPAFRLLGCPLLRLRPRK